MDDALSHTVRPLGLQRQATITSATASTPQAPVPLPVNVDTTDAKILDDDEASHPDQRDSRDIYLPNHVEFVSHIAVDVGGSLAKVVYFTRSRLSSSDAPASASTSAGPARSTAPRLDLSTSSSSLSSSYLSETGPTASGSSRSSSVKHSRQGSATGARPLPPRSPDYSLHSQPSGTLTPSAILRNDNHAQIQDHHDSAMRAMRSSLLKQRSLPPNIPGGRLNFVKFETSDIESCIEFLRDLIDSSAKANNVSIDEMRKVVKLMATGGGAHMYYELFEEELGIDVRREDEMGCLITGLNFITLIPDEVFWYSDELVSALHSPLPDKSLGRADPSQHPPSSPDQTESLPRPSPNPPLYAPMFESSPSPKLPCLLVNIGSGVSIIKVDDYGKFERVSGTSLGGGTLWGLLSMLTDAESFDEMLELSEQGDNSTVDMLVSDVYGNSNALNAFGLKSSTIASSFGKVFRRNSRGSEGAEGRKKKFSPQDICKSLLYAVSNNIGQIAHMTAEKYELDRIYFGGCFIRGHQATISTLSYAIRFWSKGTKRAFFLRHEGYLGAIGAWIKHLDDPDAAVLSELGSGGRQANGDGTRADDQESTTLVADGERVKTPSQGSTSTTRRESKVRKANGNPVIRAAGRPSGQAHAEGIDMLSMLRSLQAEHHALVEPIVSAQKVATATNANGEVPLTNGVNTDGGSDGGLEVEEDGVADVEETVETTEDLQELLAQLNAADGAADGLESKLDGLLERLDILLNSAGVK